jgi:hypothetical protein
MLLPRLIALSVATRMPPFDTHGTDVVQAWLRATLVTSWFSVAIASFLLVLRRYVIHIQTFPPRILSAADGID